MAAKKNQTTKELDNPFVYEDGMTDVVLKVGNTKIHANKGVLMSFSTFFKDMFLLGKHYGEEIVIDEDPKIFLEFFRCIYPTTWEPVTDRNFQDILRLQEKYRIGITVLSRCDVFLEEYFRNGLTYRSNFDLIAKLEIAEKYNLKKTVTYGVKAMATIDCSNVNKSTMSDKLKLTILADRLRHLESFIKSNKSCSSCTGRTCQCGNSWEKFKQDMEKIRQS